MSFFSRGAQSCQPCRKAAKAGTWYEGAAEILNFQLDEWLSSASESESADTSTASSSSSSSSSGSMAPIKSMLRAIIAPHAGYAYSAPTAAFAYNKIRPELFRRVFVLGPSHHAHFRKCSVSSFEQISTPLGNIRVDAAVRDELLSTGLFDLTPPDVDEEEHSLEMHFPFVFKMMSKAARDDGESYTIIPIMVDQMNASQIESVSLAMKKYIDDRANLFVISSDFCHWGKRFRYQPYDDEKGAIHDYIEWLDHEAMAIIKSQDRAAFAKYLAETGNTICGRHPITLFLALLEKAESSFQTRFIHYAQSSKVRQANDSSVSYSAAVIEEFLS